jgi:hypothetical protein
MIAPMNEERSPWWDLAIAIVPALVAAAAIVVPWAIDRRERKQSSEGKDDDA